MSMALGDLHKTIDSHFDHENNSEDCEGCDGAGVRIPAGPSCLLPPIPEGWCVIERCDYCEIYSDDHEAGLAVAPEARWVQCSTGGWHAIVPEPLH